jgi:hypothetical protein
MCAVEIKKYSAQQTVKLCNGIKKHAATATLNVICTDIRGTVNTSVYITVLH